MTPELKKHQENLEKMYRDLPLNWVLKYDTSGNPYFIGELKDKDFFKKMYDIDYLMSGNLSQQRRHICEKTE